MAKYKIDFDLNGSRTSTIVEAFDSNAAKALFKMTHPNVPPAGVTFISN